jgi:hypothetical protein
MRHTDIPVASQTYSSFPLTEENLIQEIFFANPSNAFLTFVSGKIYLRTVTSSLPSIRADSLVAMQDTGLGASIDNPC